MPSGFPHVPESPTVKRAWAEDYRARLIAQGERWLSLGRPEIARVYFDEARYASALLRGGPSEAARGDRASDSGKADTERRSRLSGQI